MVLKFPTKHRAVERLGLDHDDRQAALDEEMRMIDSAIAALRLRRRVLLSEYLEELRRLTLL